MAVASRRSAWFPPPVPDRRQTGPMFAPGGSGSSTCRLRRRIAVPPGVGRPRREARILVTEDNPINRLVLRAQLEKLGYQARAVASGVEAVEAVQKRAISLGWVS